MNTKGSFYFRTLNVLRREPISRHNSNELEGAPPLVCKGGLLRSNATSFLLPVPSVARS
jgi:hypothetical protein